MGYTLGTTRRPASISGHQAGDAAALVPEARTAACRQPFYSSFRLDLVAEAAMPASATAACIVYGVASGR